MEVTFAGVVDIGQHIDYIDDLFTIFQHVAQM